MGFSFTKIIAVTILLSVALPLMFLALPQKVEASVPVHETALLKEGPFDIAAWIFAKIALKILLNKLIDFVKTGGFDGRPLFVTDFEKFLVEAHQRGIGIFLNELNSDEGSARIGAPFREAILSIFNSSAPSGVQHALFDADIPDPQAFYDDFSQGGMKAFMASILEPSNNFYGTRLLENERLALQKANEIESSRIETESFGGYIGVKDCLFTEDFGAGPICLKFSKIKTPGVNVKDTLSKVLQSDIETLETADELSEIIAVFVNLLIQNILDFDTSNDNPIPPPGSNCARPPQIPPDQWVPPPGCPDDRGGVGTVTATSACLLGNAQNSISWSQRNPRITSFSVHFCSGIGCVVTVASPVVPGCLNISANSCIHSGVAESTNYSYLVTGSDPLQQQDVNIGSASVTTTTCTAF